MWLRYVDVVKKSGNRKDFAYVLDLVGCGVMDGYVKNNGHFVQLMAWLFAIMMSVSFGVSCILDVPGCVVFVSCCSNSVDHTVEYSSVKFKIILDHIPCASHCAHQS